MEKVKVTIQCMFIYAVMPSFIGLSVKSYVSTLYSTPVAWLIPEQYWFSGHELGYFQKKSNIFAYSYF